MKGAGKVHNSLVFKPKNKRSTVYKPKNKFLTKKKDRLRRRKTLKTLKRKIEKEVNNSDLGALNSYKLCLAFIKQFIKKYESVMNSGNVEKSSNYSLFATMLGSAISSVNEEYSEIVDDDELTENENVTNLLTHDPNEYLENYLDYIEDNEILEEYDNIMGKYFNGNRMEFNNNSNNIRNEYITYSGFIRDSAEAIKQTIKEYSGELKTKKKIANNVNIDDLIMGLTAIKIKGAPNAKSNVVLSNDFLNRFMKLGL